MIFNRDNIIELLRNNIATVTFIKVNGEERTMRCTLNAFHIPNASSQNGQLIIEGKRKDNANTVSVWDMDKNDWRSFRVDSVKSVSLG